MTCMAQERDSILRIRAKVDAYDELKEAKVVSEEVTKSVVASDTDDRIQLCSADKPERFRKFIGSITSELPINSSIQVVTKLVKFLNENTNEAISEQRLATSPVCLLL